MCSHQQSDLYHQVMCNCNPLPVVAGNLPSQPLTWSGAMLYGSHLAPPGVGFSSAAPPNLQNYGNFNMYLDPYLTHNYQHPPNYHQFTGNSGNNPQDLLSNGLILAKQEPNDVDKLNVESCGTTSEVFNRTNLLDGNDSSDQFKSSGERSRLLNRFPRPTSISSRRYSREQNISPWRRSRSPQNYLPISKSRSPRKYSSTRSGSPRRYSPIRNRSPRKYSPGRSSSPRRYSPRRGRNSKGRRSWSNSPSRRKSPRASSPTRSKSSTSCNLSNSQNRNSTSDEKGPSDPAKEFEKEKSMWTRTAPADLFYKQEVSNSLVVHGTEELHDLCDKFEDQLLKKPEAIRAELPKYQPFPKRKLVSAKRHAHCHSCSSSDDSSSDSDASDHEDLIKEELEYKKKHPLRLHEELWFNHPGEMNDGPLCRCSAKARRSGIRHNIYAGENHITSCDPNSNNADKLYHYRVTISPPTNFLVKLPTIIEYDAHEYIFEGFSMFSHKKLGELPQCKVIRFNIEYTIVYYEEKFPQNFTVKELNHFNKYLFHELLELVDLDFRAHGDTEGCPQYHFMPRFVRELQGNGKEILSMNEVMKYLLQSYQPLVEASGLKDILTISQQEWQDYTDKIKGMIVTYPGKKPCSLRIDQLDRESETDVKKDEVAQEPISKEEKEDTTATKESQFPQIVHFGMRPPELSYAGNPEYQKAWREYVKFRHLLANMPKPSHWDKNKLKIKEMQLQNLRTKNELKRNVTVTLSSEHFQKTGIRCDVVQHALLLPVLVSHLRFHRSLDVLEEKINYVFKNRYVLQLALTHPSYRENFGTNPDHARNSLTNCGIRQPVYGDRRIHYMNTRKRGINTLINIMSKFGRTKETESNITHNERLEFLGDAVVEFVTSVHLFHMFSDLEEGGLATYRSAIVQNQHLAVLAKKLGLEDFMLYAHGSDLCHDLELRHAMANCFEALMGALFLDGGIETADTVFGEALFQGEPELLNMWVDYPPHPLQDQEPLGDRKWIEQFPFLQKLKTFEDSIGVEFTHIRLLARAFTDRSIGFTNLTLGSNQRLEFLGDTVLQLIASEYLYKYFPEHHEGHLSLLRSSLVNNRTQAVVCDDLGMTEYALYSNPKAELKTKDRADLLEAFLGALYVDKDLEYCEIFCSICFFPRLQTFILHQDWNDPKSKLQQCCLTLRTMKGGEPEIPVYKVIESKGPTNTRIYTVAVYFKGKRLAEAAGHSIQQAEMNAAKKALKLSQGLFPQLDHQKRVISKSMNHQKPGNNLKHSRKSITKTSKTGNHEGRVVSSNYLDRNRRSRTPPLAYQSRNSPETAELLKKKRKMNIDDQEKKRSGCKNGSLGSDTPLFEKKETEIKSTKHSSNGSHNKQRESGSQENMSKKACSHTSGVGSHFTDEIFLNARPASERCENLHLLKSSVRKGPCKSPGSRRSRSLSNERSKRSDSQRSIRSRNYSSQSRNVSSTNRTLNKSKSRSPARHRSRRSQSRSPNRRYSPDRHRSSSRQKYGRKSSRSPHRNISSGRTTRSPSREKARTNFMDFMLAKQTSGVETNKGGKTPVLNHQPKKSYPFQGTSRQTCAKVPASFSTQSINHPLAPNIHVPSPQNNHVPHTLNNPPPSTNKLPHLQKQPPYLTKSSAPFHQGPPPDIQQPPFNAHFPPNNSVFPAPMNSVHVSSVPSLFKPTPPTKHAIFPPPNFRMSLRSAPPRTSLLPPNNRFPPPNKRFPPPNKRFPPPNNRFPPPNNRFPPPNNRFPPPNKRFPPPNNRFLPPNNRFPPPNNRFPPSNSCLPPPNNNFPPPSTHMPPPSLYLAPPRHNGGFANVNSNFPYSFNNLYQQ